MDIGTGIAVVGVWLFPVAALLSKQVPNGGVWLSVVIATAVILIILK